jgi:hypothetical protein
MSERRTILFWPESAAGPTNNCIGIGHVLLQRGHRVVFAVESSWDGQLERLGFEEHLVDLAEPPEGPVDAGQFWKDFIAETAPEFRRPTIEQLETVTAPIWKELIDGARYSQDRLAGIIDDVGPDVVVEDNVIAFPAMMTAHAPFVRIVSCNPLEIRDPLLPPPYSGLPTDDPAEWKAFAARRSAPGSSEANTTAVMNPSASSGASMGPPIETTGRGASSSPYTWERRACVPRSRPLPTESRMTSPGSSSATSRARLLAPREFAPRTASSRPSAAAGSSSGPSTLISVGTRSGSAGCRRSSRRLGRTRASNSEPHSVTSWSFRARWMARAVPAAPAPNTPTRATAGA